MKKMMMAVAGLAMAVVMTGCGGSPKSVAEDFAEAVAKRDVDKAVELTAAATVGVEAEKMKDLKKRIEDMGKDEIKDDKFDAESYSDVIKVPPEDVGYTIVNGVKVTNDKAEVKVQFVRGKDKKACGMDVELGKFDGKWKVTNFSYIPDGLDTNDKK